MYSSAPAPDASTLGRRGFAISRGHRVTREPCETQGPCWFCGAAGGNQCWWCMTGVVEEESGPEQVDGEDVEPVGPLVSLLKWLWGSP